MIVGGADSGKRPSSAMMRPSNTVALPMRTAKSLPNSSVARSNQVKPVVPWWSPQLLNSASQCDTPSMLWPITRRISAESSFG